MVLAGWPAGGLRARRLNDGGWTGCGYGPLSQAAGCGPARWRCRQNPSWSTSTPQEKPSPGKQRQRGTRQARLALACTPQLLHRLCCTLCVLQFCWLTTPKPSRRRVSVVRPGLADRWLLHVRWVPPSHPQTSIRPSIHPYMYGRRPVDVAAQSAYTHSHRCPSTQSPPIPTPAHPPPASSPTAQAAATL